MARRQGADLDRQAEVSGPYGGINSLSRNFY